LQNNTVIIIGGGPAGVSASLYTARAKIATKIFYTKNHALKTAHMVENYYGFAEPISGEDLYQRGLLQAKKLGVEIVEEEVVAIEELDEGLGFNVKAASTHTSQLVILATGASRERPIWQGVEKFEGMGVSYCAICDAFFFRDKDVAVAGSGLYALHEATALLPVVKSVTLITDGKELTADFPKEIKIIDKKVEKLKGDSLLSGIVFEDGSDLEISALFLAIGTAGSSGLAKAAGAVTNGGYIEVDANMNTSIPGLLAAGDCTEGIQQIAKAAYNGALAGIEAVRILRKDKKLEGKGLV